MSDQTHEELDAPMTTAVGRFSFKLTEAARESLTSLFSRRFSSAYFPAKLPASFGPSAPAVSALAVDAVCSGAVDAVDDVERVGMASVDVEGVGEGSRAVATSVTSPLGRGKFGSGASPR